MKKWVCKQCGLYQKVNLDGIKAGRKVYFFKKNRAERAPDQINTDVVKGVVLRRNDDIITILSSTGIAKVNAIDVHPEDAPTNFVYNMFGACEC